MIVLPLAIWLLSSSIVQPPAPPDTPVQLTPVPLDPGNPGRLRVGALDFLGGWVLTSRHERFGGISAMAVAGDRFTFLNDGGTLIRFRLVGGKAVDPQISWLPGTDGNLKQERDTEGMAVDPARGQAWVTLERRNEIRRFDAELAREEARVAPPAMRDWPSNGGAEGLVALRDGRFIIFSERAGVSSTSSEALLFASDPTDGEVAPVRFSYLRPAGHLPTDAAELPDGRVILLNRHFAITDGLSAVVTLIDPRDISPGAMVAGREIARLAPPLTVDNMEAIAVTQERGRTILWMASDDNLNFIQRTLLLKFALAERRRTRK